MRGLATAVMAIVALGVAAACGGGQAQKATLAFNAYDLVRDEDGMSVLRLKVTNDGEETVAIDDFGANFELKLMTKFGDLVAQEAVGSIGPLEPGETSTLVEWSGELDGSYYLYWAPRATARPGRQGRHPDYDVQGDRALTPSGWNALRRVESP